MLHYITKNKQTRDLTVFGEKLILIWDATKEMDKILPTQLHMKISRGTYKGVKGHTQDSFATKTKIQAKQSKSIW